MLSSQSISCFLKVFFGMVHVCGLKCFGGEATAQQTLLLMFLMFN